MPFLTLAYLDSLNSALICYQQLELSFPRSYTSTAPTYTPDNWVLIVSKSPSDGWQKLFEQHLSITSTWFYNKVNANAENNQIRFDLIFVSTDAIRDTSGSVLVRGQN